MTSTERPLTGCFRPGDDLLDPVRCDVNREAVDRLLQTRCANSKPEKIFSTSFVNDDTAHQIIIYPDQRVLNDLQRTRLSCGLMIRLLAQPLSRQHPSSLLTVERGGNCL